MTIKLSYVSNDRLELKKVLTKTAKLLLDIVYC